MVWKPREADVQALLDQEIQTFETDHPRSRALFEAAGAHLLNGVPLNWMRRWAGPFPLYADRASGAHVTDVDGLDYVDFCMGDTASLFGHGRRDVAQALNARLATGASMMLPTADAAEVGATLAGRFGLPSWQFAVSATDANRFILRLARAVTGKRKVLLFNGCYHGNLVEALITSKNGVAAASPEMVGHEVDPRETTEVVEFNDIEAVERVLAAGDIACVMTEPALTNCRVVLPEPGFLEAVKAAAHRHEAIFALDETHTICCGPGGYTALHDVKPDTVTLGKPIAGGVPAATYGLSADLAERVGLVMAETGPGIFAIGGTLTGHALAMAGMRVMLDHVMTDKTFDQMIDAAEAIETGVADVLAKHGCDGHVVRLGARVAYDPFGKAMTNGRDALAAIDDRFDHLLHLYMLNRGVLLTPFQNMCLVAPQTARSDVDRHSGLLDDLLTALRPS
ncbi:MAG: transaminase [Pseudomonadota bacterium]